MTEAALEVVKPSDSCHLTGVVAGQMTESVDSRLKEHSTVGQGLGRPPWDSCRIRSEA